MKASTAIRFPFSVRRSVWLNKYSTFRIGGPANYFKEVRSASEAQQVIQFLHSHNYPFIIFGKGSNCLFDDRGFDGFVLCNGIQGKEFISETTIKVYSGTSFSFLGKTLSSSGYSGLEFAVGIPGSVGGAVFMNAGIGSQDTASVIESVEVINSQGEILSYNAEELAFGYRTSRFQDCNEFILSATFRLSRNSSSAKIAKDLLRSRLLSQPYQQPSAGCIFRNPPGNSAGKLIDEAGLKGFSLGGAQISPKHANFIVNTGRATSQEVKQLIQMVRDKLQSQGINLEEEVRIIPYQLP
ncbi:UDP-N-acetylmuramate dehydrogenase [Chlamydia psittaci]|uniref:UDP-N-acetylmuramate dehydrogenase n=1 Tax=Chlamydia psittaci TaxID=83554 RepID=UPI00027E5BAE|nr:UDP-N-acetylmuramate dehydrogenase [Chlamydia psittaci]AFS28333.1 UDP-N-acetylenolpyruvoylglucosamine reductase [Chlamydia psittaci NJ1]KPZ36170.1 UDP-N-acetylenolpyruvoylglucosamine reductase [Chlamydia psittaci NJ1]MDS0919356.1 UDP-N-acetylmuramate dehydrogenase [Chlamydia psittaci]MDS0989387.1 UDP-N-acetylmuramate dehydrogenase [Chlamydia psittaci]MDS0995362.1 UDP-N-acetylmuramate dehydrogenase [Chlamydia psittaci]